MASRRRSPPPPSTQHYDYLLKIILLGPSGSGKTSLLHHFLHNAPLHLTSQTIGVEFATKILALGRRRVKLQLWDTAGTERFRSVSRSYYRGAAGAVLVWDLCSERSFADAETFLRDARVLGSRGLSVVGVGNKLDAAAGEAGEMATREVEADRARAWAARAKVPVVMETSAVSGEGVQDVFERLARMVLTKIELGEVDPDDPDSGIQYGDSGGWGFDTDDGRSLRSGMTVEDGGSLVAYSGQKRRGRGGGGWMAAAGGCC